MTNSFFQTRVHPDDIPLTAVTTPFGLYEWTVMPQGLKNSPPIHQRWMNLALCEHIGKFCHIYIDDIIIWSNSIDEHKWHINIIMKALKSANLFCNKKKCNQNWISWVITSVCTELNPMHLKYNEFQTGQLLRLQLMSKHFWGLYVTWQVSCLSQQNKCESSPCSPQRKLNQILIGPRYTRQLSRTSRNWQ